MKTSPSDMKEIQLTRGYVSLVDDTDYDWLMTMKWHAVKNKNKFYAARGINKDGKVKIYGMHRVILGLTDPSMVVDHIDGDGLNNQRSNLRVCTSHENVRNSKSRGGASKYKGVSWYRKTKKWVAAITYNRSRKTIGYFHKEEDAAKAYNEYAAKHHGGFAHLNEV